MADSDDILKGPIDPDTRTAKDLQGIVKSFGISYTGKKPAIAKRIRDHMLQHPELAREPRYQLLFFEASLAKVVPKTSVDKAREDMGAA